MKVGSYNKQMNESMLFYKTSDKKNTCSLRKCAETEFSEYELNL